MASGDLVARGMVHLSMLSLYESSLFYDCTIQVKDEDDKLKEFKCHKAVLSSVSVVFKTMFEGEFAEARFSKDHPVPMENVQAHVFEKIIRFAYGGWTGVMRCSSLEEALNAYRFAHQMQITCVLRALDNMLQRDVGSSQIFLLYDLYKIVDNEAGLKHCRLTVSHRTKEALQTDHWLRVGVDTVIDVMRLEHTTASETEMLRALLRWGRAQLPLRHAHLCIRGIEIRAKIDPCMALVRFAAVDGATMQQMQEEGVIGGDERRRLVRLPRVPRTPPTIIMPLRGGSAELHVPPRLRGCAGEVGVSLLRFRVDRPVVLTALRLAPHATGVETASLCGYAGGAATFDAEVAPDGARLLRLRPPALLAPHLPYCIKFHDRGSTSTDVQFRFRWGPKHPYSCKWLNLVLLDNVNHPKIAAICFQPER